MDVETTDCNALTTDDLEEMTLVAGNEGALVLTIDVLTEEVARWVLVTLVRDGRRLHGFGTCTLERVGGTPAVLMGVGSIRRTTKRNAVLRAIVADQMRRAVLAFPDEDVLVGARIGGPGGLEVFSSFPAVVPRPGYKASGEDRAWGSRLSKRFAHEGSYDKRRFRITGSGQQAVIVDHEPVNGSDVGDEVGLMFEGIDTSRGDGLIVFSWAMAEYLEKMLP